MSSPLLLRILTLGGTLIDSYHVLASPCVGDLLIEPDGQPWKVLEVRYLLSPPAVTSRVIEAVCTLEAPKYPPMGWGKVVTPSAISPL